jgi:1,3-beta-glucanosyltransferase GAS5
MRQSTLSPWLVLLCAVAWISSRTVQAQNASTPAPPPATCANYAPRVIIKGRKLFNTISGEYFPIRGINYYPRPNAGPLSQTNSQDFFTDDFREQLWEEDIRNFVELGVNVIRIFGVNPGFNHDAFMCALQANNIYTIISLGADCENCAVTAETAPACYHPELKNRGQVVIHRFSRYDNVLAFSAGNEVNLEVGAGNPQVNGPCLKKFVRDMRAYIDGCSMPRKIPVGVDIADIDREANALYYNCRSSDDEFENVEYLGINVYQHCDGTATDSMQLPGFNQLLADFSSFSLTVPVVFTEFGCIHPTFPTIDNFDSQRTFLQVDTIFSDPFRQEFVGGLVFEYSTELVYSTAPYPFDTFGAGNFGVGYYSPIDCDHNVSSVPCEYEPFPQYELLAAKYDSARSVVDLEPTFDDYVGFDSTALPACPSIFTPLSELDWSSVDNSADFECPIIPPIYCANVPPECVLVTNPPVSTPPTVSPRPSTRPPISAKPATPKPNSTPTKPNSTPTKPRTPPPTTRTKSPVRGTGNSSTTTDRPTRSPRTGKPTLDLDGLIPTIPATSNSSPRTAISSVLLLLISLVTVLL